ncbi:RNHCP domain-containing protein [Candidatus Parcubacteria bacterium]|nr:MAG: RNHCP domain-containing protein [Candidatus Parcubacteria bacterium]
MSLNFKRTIEDFTCENCGAEVSGNGYTNHCPKCLWSKHVDIHPGDRLADCGGLMKPAASEVRGGVCHIFHKCVKCGYEKKNRTSPKDNFDEILKV